MTKSHISFAKIPGSDLDAYHNMLIDFDIIRMTGTIEYPVSKKAANARRTRSPEDPLCWFDGVYLDGTLAGEAGCFRTKTGQLEIGYMVGKNWWGQGLASRIIPMIVQRIKASGYQGAILGTVFKDNPASQKVIKRCGFVKTGEGYYASKGRGENVLADEYVYDPDTLP